MLSKKPTLVQIGRNIRLARQGAGLSQEALALSAALDRSYVGGVERGERNISALNLCRIAHALAVTPATLLADVIYATSETEQA